MPNLALRIAALLVQGLTVATAAAGGGSIGTDFWAVFPPDGSGA